MPPEAETCLSKPPGFASRGGGEILGAFLDDAKLLRRMSSVLARSVT